MAAVIPLLIIYLNFPILLFLWQTYISNFIIFLKKNSTYVDFLVSKHMSQYKETKNKN